MLSLLLFLFCQTQSQPSLTTAELVHTYSIVAYDPETKQIGAAVQSHWFCVGCGVIWVRAGVGAVATQSLMRLDYGPLGIEAMAAGKNPADALKELTAKDPGQAVRQVAFVDVKGRVATHTGDKCIAEAMDEQGEFFSVQANLMLKDSVAKAMAEAYKGSKGKPLAERMLAALNAAQAEGGDLRGKQSAALKVASAEKQTNAWEGVLVDLRVDDHKDPLGELERLLMVHNGYEFMNKGDHALEKNDMKAALAYYGKAQALLGNRLEPKFWQAINLVNVNRVEESLPIFKEVFAGEPNWLLLIDRLPKVDLLTKDTAVLDKIKAQR